MPRIADVKPAELINSKIDLAKIFGVDVDFLGERLYLASDIDSKRMQIEEIFRTAVFHEEYDEMVVVKDVDIFSLCEHHLLPFFGKCHVAYIPDGKIIGLSKIPRIIEAFSRRLQVQERLTTEISSAIARSLRPKGVAVVIEAFHLCIAMRGVEKQNAYAITSSMKGIFRQDEKTRQEFLHLIRRDRSAIW
jgi:GTP cyclohydrolase I